uniref:OmpP1/FadL family transporter n=1 Tax=Hydrogenimonas sp. TaxID=2231112 RepID=UPI00260A9881
YFNPANMAFLPDGRSLELNLMYIHLTSIKNETTGHETKEENFLLPQLHVVTGFFDRWRWGFSITEPGGLSKRWSDAPENITAKKFQLRVFEFNPSFSYKISETLALGGGLRYIYTDGEVEAEGVLRSHMEGHGNRYGYNVALSFRPSDTFGMAVTYRNRIDLKETGYFESDGVFALFGRVGAEVSVPLPATLDVAADYTFNNGDTTLEVVYEKVYWGKYQSLDFNYDNPIIEGSIVGQPKEKNWVNTDTYRIGLTHHYDEKLTLMFGYAHDETPIPDETLGYELPDSDANIFSLGFRYKINDDMEIGMAYLLDKKDDRSVTNTSVGHAEFTNTYAHLVSFGLGYRY